MTFSWALPLLIVMQTRSAGVSPRPVAWAAQSSRPAYCLDAPGLWAASRHALRARRCRELARAQALLLHAPARAKQLASALLAEAPELTHARVIRGRANLRLGDAGAALADLSPLLEADAVGAEDPSALWDGGRAALASKALPSAARFYRALGSRAALLPDKTQQTTAHIEIAAALLASDSAPVDDVLAYLGEARRRSSGTGLSSLCAALTAVAWRGEGRESEAQGALADVTDAAGLARFRDNAAVWLAEGVLDAALAVALEKTQPEAAAQHYRALADSPLREGKLGNLTPRPAPAKRGPR